MDASHESNRVKNPQGGEQQRLNDSRSHDARLEGQERGPSGNLPAGRPTGSSPSGVPGSDRGTALDSTAHANPGTAIALKEIESLDWNATHHVRFTKEQEAILRQPVNRDLVEVRYDGAVYMPGAWYRKVLNDAFGPGGWRVLPLGNPYQDGKSYGLHAALIAEGRVVAVTYGEFTANQTRKEVTKGTIYESLCTDVISKACKTLGVAEELWFPSWARTWLKEYAESTYDKVNQRSVWRRKDDLDSYSIGKPGDHHESEYRRPPDVRDEIDAHMTAIKEDKPLRTVSKSEYQEHDGSYQEGRQQEESILERWKQRGEMADDAREGEF